MFNHNYMVLVLLNMSGGNQQETASFLIVGPIFSKNNINVTRLRIVWWCSRTSLKAALPSNFSFSFLSHNVPLRFSAQNGHCSSYSVGEYTMYGSNVISTYTYRLKLNLNNFPS